MLDRQYLNYLTAIAIAKLAIGIALGIQFTAVSQTESNAPLDPPAIDFKSRISSQQANFRQIATLEGHIQDISLLSFSTDGLIASVESDAIIIWQGDKIRRILPGHYSSETQMTITPIAIAFSPDSRFLATATWSQGVLTPDNSIIVWEIETGKPVLTVKGNIGCRQVLFDPEGKILYGACGMGIQAWDFPSGQKLFSFDTEYPNEAIALSPDGKVMATAGGQRGSSFSQEKQSNIIQLWQLDRQEATLLNTLSGHSNDIARLEFTANGRRLVSSSYDGKIKVWDWKKGAENSYINNLYSDNGVFSLSADSRLIAGNFNSFSMANLVTGLPLTISSLFPQITPNAVAFSKTSELLAWGGKSPKSPNPIISVWAEVDDDRLVTTTNPISSSREGYIPLTLAQYWGKNEGIETNNPAVSVDLKSPVDTDIKAMALDVFGLTETVENEQQEVEVSDGIFSVKIVTITQTNLPDDSITAMRYRVEFAPYGDVEKGEWRVIWAGQQFKCQPNRGHQDWSEDLCQ